MFTEMLAMSSGDENNYYYTTFTFPSNSNQTTITVPFEPDLVCVRWYINGNYWGYECGGKDSNGSTKLSAGVNNGGALISTSDGITISGTSLTIKTYFDILRGKTAELFAVKRK